MFRCFDCGKSFDDDEILELAENDGFREGPYRTSYVCPHCKCNMYKPFLKDRVSRRRVIEALLDVMLMLNEFDEKICSAFNSTATKETGLDYGRNKIFEFLVELAEGDEFDVPKNIDDLLFNMQTMKQASKVAEILTRNIEGD